MPELVVNGERHTVEAADDEPLVRVLREGLGLHGVRLGCGVGECGACTVLLDGVPTRSCDIPVSTVDGRAVTTPEGLGSPDRPHPVQEAFLDGQAAQCGYCVNGMIMTVFGVTARGGSLPDVRAALEDHICRCGTHARLLAAAERVAGGERDTTDRPARVLCRDAPVDGTTGPLPDHVVTQPRVEQWLRMTPAGRVQVLAGKVEIGQGIRTALAQVVASQLGLPLDLVDVVPTSTDVSPDQRYTSGSESIQDGGRALAHAAVALRRLAVERAATRTGRPVDELRLGPAGVVDGTGTVVCDIAGLLAEGDIDGVIHESDRPDWRLPPLGEAAPRSDLARKLTGAAAYLHDVEVGGMLHARVVLPPTPDARLLDAPVERTRGVEGVVEVHVDGRLVLVVAESSRAAERGAAALARDLRWEAVPLEPPRDLEAAFRAAPAERHVVRQDAATQAADGWAIERTYDVGYRSHGPVAPSVAIASWEGGHLSVLSHTQGVHPLRRELATLLQLDEASISVEHHDGPGCYGMNGADDAAAFAAIAATVVPGRPVRLQLTMSDEFGWAPLGPAMVVDLRANTDRDGRVTSWGHRGFSDVHKTRPNGSGTRLVPAWLRSTAVARPWPGPEEGGARNAVPLYDLPQVDAAVDYVRGPVRTSALRCLGAVANVFAIESFMDELAEQEDQDPVAFRRAHLTDPRAREVLDVVVERVGWRPHVGPSGAGVGIAVARYKNSRAWVALVAAVAADLDAGTFRVERLDIACDAGTVVNPDGLRNQLEGGALQGLSRAMHEEVQLGDAGVTTRDWTTYGTLRFSDVPAITVDLVDRPGAPPLGAGEAATPLVAPALANALDDAFGIRLRRLPLSARALERRLLELDTDESARVLIGR